MNQESQPKEHHFISIGPVVNTARCTCGYIHPIENGKMEIGWATDGRLTVPLTTFLDQLETDVMF